MVTLLDGPDYDVGSPCCATVNLLDDDEAVGNDDFASALPFLSLQTRGTNRTASVEVGEQNHDGKRGGRSVWWSWTASFTGMVTFSTAGSNFDTLLAVYRGNSLNSLTQVATNDNADGDNTDTSKVTFEAIAGTVYRIAVDGFEGAGGAIELSRTPDVPPSVSVVAIVAETDEGERTGGIVRFSRTGATTSPLEVRFAVSGSAAPGADFVQGSTRFTIPAGAPSGELSFKSIDDTLIEQDESILVGLIDTPGYSITPGEAEVTIMDNDKADGNDLFIFAEQMTTAFTAGNNSSATIEQNEASHAGQVGGKSLWWRWQAPFSGIVEFDTGGSSFDTLMAVYTGSTLATLTQVAANDDHGGALTSQVSFSALEGSTYHIVVDGKQGTSGTIKLERRGDPKPKPVVRLAIIDEVAKEAGRDPGHFQLTRSGDLAAPLRARIELTGTAEMGTDFDPIDADLEFPPGNDSIDVAIVPKDDFAAEGGGIRRNHAPTVSRLRDWRRAVFRRRLVQQDRCPR